MSAVFANDARGACEQCAAILTGDAARRATRCDMCDALLCCPECQAAHEPVCALDSGVQATGGDGAVGLAVGFADESVPPGPPPQVTAASPPSTPRPGAHPSPPPPLHWTNTVLQRAYRVLGLGDAPAPGKVRE